MLWIADLELVNEAFIVGECLPHRLNRQGVFVIPHLPGDPATPPVRWWVGQQHHAHRHHQNHADYHGGHGQQQHHGHESQELRSSGIAALRHLNLCAIRLV